MVNFKIDPFMIFQDIPNLLKIKRMGSVIEYLNPFYSDFFEVMIALVYAFKGILYFL